MKREALTAAATIKVGDTAPNFVPELARLDSRLKYLSFTIYSPTHGVRDRIDEFARLPAAEVVAQFLHHDNSPNDHWRILASELTAEVLNDKISGLPSSLALALDSKCIFADGSLKYIPMMDFQLPPSAENLELLKEFLKQTGNEGLIVDSGASYHFYGFDFLDHRQWIKFMGECLLAPWPDPRWIGHSLIEDGGALRVSTSERKQKLPSVCEVLLK
jgi:hypothetical protein